MTKGLIRLGLDIALIYLLGTWLLSWPLPQVEIC